MKYKSIEELTLADDFMFYKVMGRPEIAKQFLEHLLRREIKTVTSVVPQSTFKDERDSHGVRFDVEFVGDDTVYDIEMQQSGGSSQKQQAELLRRVRFYQASLDYKYFKQGVKYSEMKPTYVIFICTFDPFQYGLAKYTQVPYIQEMELAVDNGATAIFLNTDFNIPNADEVTLNFLRYIRNPDEADWVSDSFLYDVNNAVEDSKVNTDTRREFMTLTEKLSIEREEGREEGIEEGLEKAIVNVMKTLRCTREQATIFVYGRPPAKSPSQMDVKGG